MLQRCASAEELFHPIGPGLALRRVAVAPVVQRSLELPQDGLLLVAQAHWRFDRHVAIQIAGVTGAHAAYALAAQAEGLARLRTFGNRDLGLAAQRGHLQLAAQCRRGERNGQLAVQVVAIALEDLVRLDVDFHVQVARRPAVDARLAIAAGADAHAVIDARRNLDLQGLVAAYTAYAIAGRARVGDFLARPVAGGAGLLHAEKALLHAYRARAAACAARLGRRAGFGAAAVAGIAVFPAGHADFGVETMSGLLQRDFQRVLQIGAAVHLRAAAAAARTAEYFAEDVAEGIGKSAAHARAAHARGIGIDARMTITVVGRALLLVAQDFVGFFDF